MGVRSVCGALCCNLHWWLVQPLTTRNTACDVFDGVGAWPCSPTAPYMAVGTMAGAIDLSFSSSACLEIFNLDFADASTDMPLAGEAVATSERFHRLVWGTTAADSETYPVRHMPQQGSSRRQASSRRGYRC